jgi:hypothetical protein
VLAEAGQHQQAEVVARSITAPDAQASALARGRGVASRGAARRIESIALRDQPALAFDARIRLVLHAIGPLATFQPANTELADRDPAIGPWHQFVPARGSCPIALRSVWWRR